MATEGDIINVEQFLKDNKLYDALEIFIKREISIEELMEFEQSDLKQFGKDIGLDVLQINRLVNAIKKLSSSLSSKQEISATAEMYRANQSPIIHFIVSEQEQNAISKFNKIYNNTLLMINNLNACFKILDENTEKAKQNLHNVLYQEIINNLEDKRKKLINDLKEIHNNKQSELYQQLNELKIHQTNINNAKMEYQSLVSDPTLELKYRKRKIKKLVQTIDEKEDENKYISFPYYLITEPNITINKSQFQYLQDTFSKNVSISSCDFPTKLSISIKKSNYNSLTIKWKINDKSNDDSRYATMPILKYEIQYSQYKSDDNDDEKRNIDKVSWKTAVVSGKKKSYKIINLSTNTKYSIRMRAENQNGYGQFSNLLYSKTTDMKLIWDQKNHGNMVQFIKKNRVKCGGNNQQNIAVCSYKIDAKKGNTFSWEIVLHTISNYSWIGFVGYPSTSYITNWNYFLGGMAHVYSIGIGPNARTASINASSHPQSNGKSIQLNATIKMDDVIKFKVNWKKKCIDIYLNNQLLKLNGKSVFENLTETAIVPAVSCNTSVGEYSIRLPLNRN